MGVLLSYPFDRCLDIGSGCGRHTQLLEAAGRRVTAIDLGNRYRGPAPHQLIVGDYMETQLDGPYDAIWCNHVLEHQRNVNAFLEKVRSDLKEGGILAISVPPLKHAIVGGHLTLWNAGLLLYNLIVAGFDCSQARVRSRGYNISVILEKKSITLPPIVCDRGDIETLAEFFPKSCRRHGFEGRIPKLNWGV